jgi:hypothetical protein
MLTTSFTSWVGWWSSPTDSTCYFQSVKNLLNNLEREMMISKTVQTWKATAAEAAAAVVAILDQRPFESPTVSEQ